MFEKFKRARNQDGTFKKDVWWTPWSDSWEYKLSEDLKDMLERTAWTFIEAFIGALTVAPLVGVEAETIQLAALAGGGAALAVVKTYDKKTNYKVMDKVGQGYAGLGKQELKKRKEQHTALRNIAMSKSIGAAKQVKEMQN